MASRAETRRKRKARSHRRAQMHYEKLQNGGMYSQTLEQPKETKPVSLAAGRVRVEHLSISKRTITALTKAGIIFQDQLEKYDEDDLLQLDRIGLGSVEEIRKACPA